MTLIFAILIAWWATMIVTEAKITEPLRDFVGGRNRRPDPGYRPFETMAEYEAFKPWRRPRLRYLVTCRMCAGFWVSLVVGLLAGVNPLVVAAGAHWVYIFQTIAERKAR